MYHGSFSVLRNATKCRPVVRARVCNPGHKSASLFRTPEEWTLRWTSPSDVNIPSVHTVSLYEYARLTVVILKLARACMHATLDYGLYVAQLMCRKHNIYGL